VNVWPQNIPADSKVKFFSAWPTTRRHLAVTDFNSNDPSELSHKSANCLVDDSTTVYKYCPGIIIIAIIIFVFSVVKIPRVKSYVKIIKNIPLVVRGPSLVESCQCHAK